MSSVISDKELKRRRILKELNGDQKEIPNGQVFETIEEEFLEMKSVVSQNCIKELLEALK